MNKPRVILIVESLIYAALGTVGLMPAIMSPMMFDSPGSTQNPATLALFASVASFPLACLTGIIGAWILYAKGRAGWARVFIHLPLINLALLAIAVAVLAVLYQGELSG